jgi:DNA-damage-inducible protein J
MAGTTNLNIRIDKDLKEQTEFFFRIEIGHDFGFYYFVPKSLWPRKIPFEISLGKTGITI